MNIKPLNGRVIIQPAVKEDVTKSGIILPGSDQEKPEKGKVIAVGEGKMMENGTRTQMSVKIGDIVLFKKYSPDEIEVKGEDVLVLDESDILAVIG